MRISDWSSDVCSSDLATPTAPKRSASDACGKKGWQAGNRLKAALIRKTLPGAVWRVSRRFGTCRENVATSARRDHGCRRNLVLYRAGQSVGREPEDRKSTRLTSSHQCAARMPSSARIKKNRLIRLNLILVTSHKWNLSKQH